ncbi:MAG TPA: tetratricopeptide repeat protein [Candidatus Elarobacter sp.]|nr:tetratricopeptide repeat protein [Candidatus Elarobacter sp.]
MNAEHGTGASIAELFEHVRRNPRHYGALMRLGTLLAETGNDAAARTVYAQAVREHPSVAGPYVCLGTLLVDAGEHADAVRLFASALELDPGNREALRGLAVVHEREGELDAAGAVWRRAFPGGSFETSGYRGAGTPVRVLYLTSAVGGNVPMRHVFDPQLFEVTTLIAESAPAQIVLPAHDVVFNAVGDADRSTRALAAAQRIGRATRAPVVNDPARVRATTRLHNASRLAALTDVVTARMAELPRAGLVAPEGAAALAAAGFAWPVLLRSPGYQTGEHFVRVDGPSSLAGVAAALPGEALLAIAYVDSRGADGAFRKYRVMTIGGALYPIHLAIAPEWKVHYFRSAMADRPEHRAEEAAFLADAPGVLGERVLAALDRVAAALGLDYGGIDFTPLPDGRVLVFEANATMVLVPPEPDAKWDYRRDAIARALDAARAMLVSRARTG